MMMMNMKMMTIMMMATLMIVAKTTTKIITGLWIKPDTQIVKQYIEGHKHIKQLQ